MNEGRTVEQLTADLAVARARIEKLQQLLGLADRAVAASLAFDGAAFGRLRTAYLDARAEPR